MRMIIQETGIEIIPETSQDIIYIEHFLNLKKDNDFVKCKRINAMGLHCISHLEIKPLENKNE